MIRNGRRRFTMHHSKNQNWRIFRWKSVYGTTKDTGKTATNSLERSGNHHFMARCAILCYVMETGSICLCRRLLNWLLLLWTTSRDGSIWHTRTPALLRYVEAKKPRILTGIVTLLTRILLHCRIDEFLLPATLTLILLPVKDYLLLPAQFPVSVMWSTLLIPTYSMVSRI